LVGQAGSHAAALCRQFAQVNHFGMDASHCESLEDVHRLETGTNTEWVPSLRMSAFHPIRTLAVASAFEAADARPGLLAIA
jgi:hypothetical protein